MSRREHKGKDHLKPGSPQAEARQARWAHNALTGHHRRAEIYIWLVQETSTCTPEAKALAAEIEPRLERLRLALKTRVDPL